MITLIHTFASVNERHTYKEHLAVYIKKRSKLKLLI